MLMSGRRLKVHVGALGRSTDPTARVPESVGAMANRCMYYTLFEQGASNDAIVRSTMPLVLGGQPFVGPCPGGLGTIEGHCLR